MNRKTNKTKRVSNDRYKENPFPFNPDAKMYAIIVPKDTLTSVFIHKTSIFFIFKGFTTRIHCLISDATAHQTFKPNTHLKLRHRTQRNGDSSSNHHTSRAIIIMCVFQRRVLGHYEGCEKTNVMPFESKIRKRNLIRSGDNGSGLLQVF